MLYIVGILLLLVGMVVKEGEVEDPSLRVLLEILAIIILTVVFALFTSSNVLCDTILKEYEQGKIVKEYIIIGSDTTYKYIYNCD